MTEPDLIHYPDSRPGITRHRAGRGFSYRAPDGTRIEDADERARLAAMAVPPAYEDVWMCPVARGHLQATGRDAKARKQYRYHPDWTAFRARKKFDDLPRFGAALPALRRRIAADLRREDADRPFAIAAVLAMIDRMSLRIGNAGYAQGNGAYGATTLRSRHMRVDDDGAITLRFTAKGGQKVRRPVHDRTLQRTLHRLDDLSGATLVGWVDDDGTAHSVSSDAVNAALAEMTGEEGLTAKTFRTWNGTVAALHAALTDGKRTIKAMSEAAAKRLANTPAIARKSYIHPSVIALSEADAKDIDSIRDTMPDIAGLRQDERRMMALLGG
ncbi:DNA topoisomerase IB [Oceaniglobus trochenteri]|uniref:DNA topoisomerase IB n=1 Tax=Oceaniglobus trochenteri TaxID=2763260 RepID=UPI001D00196E